MARTRHLRRRNASNVTSASERALRSPFTRRRTNVRRSLLVTLSRLHHACSIPVLAHRHGRDPVGRCACALRLDQPHQRSILASLASGSHTGPARFLPLHAEVRRVDGCWDRARQRSAAFEALGRSLTPGGHRSRCRSLARDEAPSAPPGSGGALLSLSRAVTPIPPRGTRSELLSRRRTARALGPHAWAGSSRRRRLVGTWRRAQARLRSRRAPSSRAARDAVESASESLPLPVLEGIVSAGTTEDPFDFHDATRGLVRSCAGCEVRPPTVPDHSRVTMSFVPLIASGRCCHQS